MMMNELEITQQDSDLSFDELEGMVNSILLKKTSKGLTDLQVKILEGIFNGKTYRDIAEGINYQEQSIKNEAPKLFTLLNDSGELEEEINSRNLVSVLKRHKKKHQNLDNNHHGAKKAEQHKVIVIDGKLDHIDQAKIEAIVKLLQNKGKDISIEIVNVEEGSIKITIKGTEEGLARLQELFDSGELNELEGFEVLELRDLDETEQERLNSSLKKAQLNEAITGNTVDKKTDLSWANLSWANLRGANLIEANLIGANLIGANLIEANLRGANLIGANLSRANLRGAYLIEANLREAYLIGADLSGANLSGTQVEGAIFINTQGISEATKKDLISRGTIFDDLSWANLSGADLRGANLSGVDLYGADLSGANLIRAILILANLRRTNLRRADLRGANLSEADLSRANLSGADLSWADLSWADLSWANLSGTQVEGAIFIDSQGISEATKEDLKLRGAIFDDFPHDPSKVKILV